MIPSLRPCFSLIIALTACYALLHGCASMDVPLPESFSQAVFDAREQTKAADKYITIQMKRVPPRYTKAQAAKYIARIDKIDKDIDDLEALTNLTEATRMKQLDGIILILLTLEGEYK